MKALKMFLKRMITYAGVVSVIVFLFGDVLYSSSRDESTDRVSYRSAEVFSPGYINSIIQKSRAIVDQENRRKGFLESAAEYIKQKVSNRVTEESSDKVVPELKGPSSATASSGTGSSQTSAAIGANSETYVPTGTATNIETDSAGKVIAETFGNVRHVYVGTDSSYKYNTIQDALNAANTGDVVFVKNGTYTGSVSIVKNGVSIIGESAHATILNLSEVSSFGITASNVTVKNITFDGNNTGSGIRLSGANNATIQNNIIKNMAGTALDVYASDNSSISYNTLANNQTGITLFNMGYWSNASIKYNIISNSRIKDGAGGGGIAFRGPVKAEVVGNEIFGNQSAAMLGASSNLGTFNNNYIYGNNTLNKVDTYMFMGDFLEAVNTSGYGNFATAYVKPPTNINSANLVFSPLNERSKISSEAMASSNGDLYKTALSANKNAYNNTDAGVLLKGLLTGDGGITEQMMVAQGIAPDRAKALIDGSVQYSDLLSGERTPEMEAALKLADIMKNPNEGQKKVIDVVTAILDSLKDAEKDSANPEALQKAEKDLMQAAAAALLTQAMPDLLKAGDVANIKGIFSELGKVNADIVMKYNEATRPYYDEVKKMLAANAEVLRVNNILSDAITDKDLEKMPRNEVDKILEKIRKARSRTPQEEYILQQEGKYRQKYVEPNSRILESDMKNVLQNFTKQINTVLNSSTPTK